jgi:HNH endonuclease
VGHRGGRSKPRLIEWRLDYSGPLPSPCWIVISHALRSKAGYVKYWHNGKSIDLHRFAYLSLFGRILDGLHVRHACDRKSCISPVHLSVGTHADNMADMVARKRQPYGERNARAKLTDQLVLEIYARLEAGHSQASLAREFGVSNALISLLAKGMGWKHEAPQSNTVT